MYSSNQPISFESVLLKGMKYCAYQERCSKEVEQKAKEWGADEKMSMRLIKRLQKENFLNEKRYAESYVRGKFELKSWGKLKLRAELRSRGIPEKWIERGIKQLSVRTYKHRLKQLFEQKQAQTKGDSDQSGKIYRYLKSKGYESELIMDLLRKKGLI